jgi:signal transduction histidine kinase
LQSPLVLSPENHRLEISYAANHLGAQGGLRYRYKMDGLEPWTEAWTRRTAYYTHLPPGHYRFHVQAFEIDTPEAVTETLIEIVQRPPFYETPWFLTFCTLLLLGLILCIYRFRIHQMRLKFKTVNEERVRLAREMHDTVIQGCVGISTLLEAAQGLEGADEPLRRNLLNYAIEQVRGTIDSARNAVWAMRNLSTSDGNIGQHCQDLLRRLQLDSDIPLHCTISGSDFPMGEDATRELLMTIKEAVLNAIAHAAASAIHVSVFFARDEMTVLITDNGRGFDPHEAAQRKGHFGIIGMMERTRLLGGTLTIESEPNKGTTLRMKVPRINRRMR